MYFLAPRIRLRVLLACALMLATMSIMLGRAVGEEVNAQPKGDAVVTVQPRPAVPMTPRQMRELDKNLRKFFEAHEKLRWILKTPRKIDGTGRLQRVPGLWGWAV